MLTGEETAQIALAKRDKKIVRVGEKRAVRLPPADHAAIRSD